MKLIAACPLALILILGGAIAHAAEDPLAVRAQAILQSHCARCHGDGSPAKGGFDYVLDRNQLVARDQIVPGQPNASPLYQRVVKKEMPPADQKNRLRPAELAVLRQWIETGAPAASPSAEPRKFMADAEVLRFVFADLNRTSPRQRRFLRYLTLTHLANAGRGDAELQSYRQALAKLLNSLSWHPRIRVPRAIDPAGTICRIDLRDYQWNARLWERMLSFYPYRLPSNPAAPQALTAATGSEWPLVWGDWFLATASQAPLYYELLQLPTNDRELERQLRIDVLTNIDEETARRTGFNNSGVSRNNRLLERHDAAFGAYWRSYDFADNLDRHNLFDHPLGPVPGQNSFVASGGEIIFNLPNGLQGYMLIDGNGRRIDRAAIEIVSDPNRPDRFVQAGVSCMNCHGKGILPKTDQVRAHVEQNPNAYSQQDREIVRALYPPAAKFLALVNADTDRYQKALAQTGLPGDRPDPISTLTLRFEGVVDLPGAAAEVGLQPDDFVNRLRGSSSLVRSLGPLMVKGGAVSREVFQTAFPDLVREFKLVEGLEPFSVTSALIGLGSAGKPFAGHKGPVLCVAMSADGKRALSGSEDKTVRLWDVANGTELRCLEGHTGEVLAVAFSPDGKHAVSAGQDRTVRLWDLVSGRELRRFLGHTDKVSSVAFAPDSKRILSGSWDQTLRLWDVTQGLELRRLAGHRSWVAAVAFSPDGRQALSGGYDHTVRLWDLGSGREVHRFEGHLREVYSVAFSPDGRKIVSGGNDRTVRLWDVDTSNLLHCLEGHANAVIQVAFSTDGRQVFSGSSRYLGSDQPIRVWDAATGKLLHGYGGAAADSVWCIAFTAAGRALSGSSDRTLRLWVLVRVKRTEIGSPSPTP
jgi:mono/diheme cytochrome c family protein